MSTNAWTRNSHGQLATQQGGIQQPGASSLVITVPSFNSQEVRDCLDGMFQSAGMNHLSNIQGFRAFAPGDRASLAYKPSGSRSQSTSGASSTSNRSSTQPFQSPLTLTFA